MRCYNGAPDSRLQAWLDRQSELMRELPEGTHCTYFPMEGQYQVWENLKPVTSMHSTREEAVAEWRRKQ